MTHESTSNGINLTPLPNTPFIRDGFVIQSRGCMVTIGKAIRENWQISETTKDDIIRQLGDIIKNDTRDRWRIRATKLVTLMMQQNGSTAV